MIMQTIMAALGSVGFAIFFKMKGKQLAYVMLGSAITWIIFLFAEEILGGVFVPNLCAAIFVGIFSEIMARVNKAPSTIFLITAALPLIPGGRLYYAVQGVILENLEQFRENAVNTLLIALAIALGFMIVAIFEKYINYFSKNNTNGGHEQN